MALISRLYNFVAGTPAVGDQVDAELDQLVAVVNNIESANLSPTILRAVASADRVAGDGVLQDITGASIALTPSVPSVAVVWCVHDFSMTPVGAEVSIIEGHLDVDGVDQTAIATGAFKPPAGGQNIRVTASQVYLVSLTAAAHTLKLRNRLNVSGTSGGDFRTKATNTSITALLMAS